jgi:hypothetical protein
VYQTVREIFFRKIATQSMTICDKDKADLSDNGAFGLTGQTVRLGIGLQYQP